MLHHVVHYLSTKLNVFNISHKYQCVNVEHCFLSRIICSDTKGAEEKDQEQNQK